MRSSRIVALLAPAAALAFGGCTFFKTDEPVVVRPIEANIAGASAGCLSEAPGTIRAFFDGTAQPTSVEKLATCVEDSILLLKAYVRGATPGLYSAREIQTFLEKYFVREGRIPQGLFDEGMALKTAALGGSAGSVTAAELDATIELVRRLAPRLVDLIPEMPLSWNRLVGGAPENSARFFDRLRAAADAVGVSFRESGAEYPFSRLEALVTELDRAYSGGSDSPFSLIRDYIPAARYLKAILKGTSEASITGGEWGETFRTLIGGFELAIDLSRRPSGGLASLLGTWARAVRFVIGETASVPGGAVSIGADAPLRKALEQGIPAKYFKSPLVAEDWTRLGESVFKLKAGALGGSAAALSRQELEFLAGTLDLAARHAGPLQRFLEMSLDELLNLNRVDAEIFTKALQDMGAALGARVEPVGGLYLFRNLNELIDLTGRLLSDRPEWSRFLEFWRTYHPLLYQAKSMLIAPAPDRIAPGQWGSVFSDGGRWVALGFQGLAFFAGEVNPFYGDGLAEFESLWRKLVILLKDSVSRQPDAVIAVWRFRLLISTLPASFPIPQDILHPLVGAIFEKIFSVEGVELGLSRPVLEVLDQRIMDYVLGQNYATIVFRAGAGSERYSSARLSPGEIFRIADRPEVRAEIEDAGIPAEAIDRMDRMILTYRPLFPAPDWTPWLGPGPLDPAVSFFQLSHQNWMDVFARTVFPGYIRDPARKGQNLKIAGTEFDEIYRDFRALGIRLHLFDPRTELTAFRRMREGNLFTFHADGDGFLSVAETVDMLSLLIPAKLHANRIHREISRECPTAGDDIFGFKYVEARCFGEVFFGRYSEHWKGLPLLSEAYLQLSPSEKRAFATFLDRVSTLKDQDVHKIESTESETMMVILYYVESLFARFDRDGSGTFTAAEVELLFEVFRRDLGLLARTTDRNTLFALLHYLLQTGRAPDNKLGFWLWMQFYSPGDTKAGRLRIIEILSAL